MSICFDNLPWTSGSHQPEPAIQLLRAQNRNQMSNHLTTASPQDITQFCQSVSFVNSVSFVSWNVLRFGGGWPWTLRDP